MRGNGSRPSFPAAPPGPPPSRAPARTGLPPIAPPPRKISGTGHAQAPSHPPSPPSRHDGGFDHLAQTVTAVASPNAQPTRKGDSRAEVDLDWSDEEESTSVYAGAKDEAEPAQPPRGPYDVPSVIAPQAPMSAPSLREPSSQIAHRPAGRGQHTSDPQPGSLRETTRGARIVPPALLSSGGTAPPGPASRSYEDPRSASVTEALPQEAPAYQQPNPYANGGHQTPMPNSAQMHHAAAQAAQVAMQQAVQQVPATSTPSPSHRYRSEMPPANNAGFRPPVAPIVPLAAPAQDPPRRAGLFIAAAAAVIVALVSVFFLLRRPGELVVDVRDPKGAALPRAEIFVDGRKVCDSTPCVVQDLEPGARLIKATSPGYQTPAPTTVQVEGGRRGEMVVTLAPSTAILVAKGDQPGVKVYVDGVDRGALPAKLEDVQPGARDVRFDGGERYKSLEKVVDLKAGDTTDLGAIRLDVLRGQITIELASDDARVTIQKDQDGAGAKVVSGPFPKTIELDGSAKWRVVSTKRGLPDYVARFDFSDGVAVKTVRISMEPEKKEEPVAAADPVTPPPPGPGPGPAPPPDKKGPDKKEPDKKDEPVAAGGNGFVNINSIPVSRVLVDGSPKGETPLSGVSLPAGLHTVTFIHPELGRKSVVVKVEPGKTATASAKLRD
jgi:hypothetical protein